MQLLLFIIILTFVTQCHYSHSSKNQNKNEDEIYNSDFSKDYRKSNDDSGFSSNSHKTNVKDPNFITRSVGSHSKPWMNYFQQYLSFTSYIKHKVSMFISGISSWFLSVLSICTYLPKPISILIRIFFDLLEFHSFVFFHREFINPPIEMVYKVLSLDIFSPEDNGVKSSSSENDTPFVSLLKEIDLELSSHEVFPSFIFAIFSITNSKINSYLAKVVPFITGLFSVSIFLAEYIFMFFLFRFKYHLIRYFEDAFLKRCGSFLSTYIFMINCIKVFTMKFVHLLVLPYFNFLEKFCTYFYSLLSVLIKPIFNFLLSKFPFLGPFINFLIYLSSRITEGFRFIAANIKIALDYSNSFMVNALELSGNLFDTFLDYKHAVVEISEDLVSTISNSTENYLAPPPPPIATQIELDKECQKRLGGGNGGTSIFDLEGEKKRLRL
ncbi:hypothetical protein MDAP_000321 [Mitosporidium daphniae]